MEHKGKTMHFQNYEVGGGLLEKRVMQGIRAGPDPDGSSGREAPSDEAAGPRDLSPMGLDLVQASLRSESRGAYVMPYIRLDKIWLTDFIFLKRCNAATIFSWCPPPGWPCAIRTRSAGTDGSESAEGGRSTSTRTTRTYSYTTPAERGTWG